jgi:hypothetical protein
MTPIQRMSLAAFGLFTWASAMFTAADPVTGLVADVAAIQAGLGAGLLVTALLPGRMARFC